MASCKGTAVVSKCQPRLAFVTKMSRKRLPRSVKYGFPLAPLPKEPLLNAIKEAKKLIAKDPFKESAKTLADLVLSLDSREPFHLERLYGLDLDDFDLAVQIVKEWRLDRYYAGKAKLYDFALQANALSQSPTQAEQSAPASHAAHAAHAAQAPSSQAA
jgi:hypothetical protein